METALYVVTLNMPKGRDKVIYVRAESGSEALELAKVERAKEFNEAVAASARLWVSGLE